MATEHRHDSIEFDLDQGIEPVDIDDSRLIGEVQDEMTRAVLSLHRDTHSGGFGPSIPAAEPDDPAT